MLHLLVLSSLPLLGLAVPVNTASSLETRANKCSTTAPGRANPPCICGGTVGLRFDSIRSRCQARNQAVVFKNPTSTTDFSMQLSSTFTANQVQCDHIVELQFIADQINADDGGICTALVDSATKLPTAAYENFFQTLNSQSNVVFVDSDVNSAKGVIVSGGNFGQSKTKKTATGVVNYLKLLEAGNLPAPSMKFATNIETALDNIVGAGNGFTSLQALWDAKVDSFVKNLENCQIPNLTRREERDASLPFWKRYLAGRQSESDDDFVSLGLSCPLPSKNSTTTSTSASSTSSSASSSASSKSLSSSSSAVSGASSSSLASSSITSSASSSPASVVLSSSTAAASSSASIVKSESTAAPPSSIVVSSASPISSKPATPSSVATPPASSVVAPPVKSSPVIVPPKSTPPAPAPKPILPKPVTPKPVAPKPPKLGGKFFRREVD